MTGQQMTRAPKAPITGSYHDAQAVTSRLQAAAKQFHLVSPATTAPTVPEGCDVVISRVVVDADHDTYEIVKGKQHGLSKTALQQIAAAAGVSWDASRSGRTDDGSDPHYCAWQAVGYVRHFDGTTVEIVGNKEMDLREGSAQVEGMMERYRTGLAEYQAGRKKWAPKDPTAQIREMRLHIAQHAETKAQLRAIRSLGLRTSYHPDELKKPFIVARLMFTGRTDNPELQRVFAEKTADAMLAGSRALYGSGAPRPALRPGQTRKASPPPVGSVPAEPDDFAAPEDTRAIDTTGEASCGTQAPAQAAPQGDVDTSRFTVPGGRDKGKSLPEASDSTIGYWRERIATALDEGTSKFPDKDEQLLAALEAEFTKRRLGGDAPAQEQAPASGEAETQPEFSLDG